jgi:hypothetical protein
MTTGLVEIMSASAITIISLTTQLNDEKTKRLTKYGYTVLVLSVVIIFSNFKGYYDQNQENKVLKKEDIYAEIVISTNSKARMDSISANLPEKLNLRDVKIGNDRFQIDFEKEMANSGKGRSLESWHLYYKSVFINFDELRLDSKTVDEINGKTFEIRIPQLDDLNCDSRDITVQFSLVIRGKSSRGFIGCGEYYSLKLEDIE